MELSYLISASCPYLNVVDPVTKWPLFALAGKCDLKTIYTLLRKNPEHIEMTEDGNCKFIPVEKCRRKKTGTNNNETRCGTKRKTSDHV